MNHLCVLSFVLACICAAAFADSACKKQGGYCTNDACEKENSYMVTSPGLCSDAVGCCVSRGHPGGDGPCVARKGVCLYTSLYACDIGYFDDDETLCAGGKIRRCCLWG